MEEKLLAVRIFNGIITDVQTNKKCYSLTYSKHSQTYYYNQYDDGDEIYKGSGQLEVWEYHNDDTNDTPLPLTILAKIIYPDVADDKLAEYVECWFYDEDGNRLDSATVNFDDLGAEEEEFLVYCEICQDHFTTDEIEFYDTYGTECRHLYYYDGDWEGAGDFDQTNTERLEKALFAVLNKMANDLDQKGITFFAHLEGVVKGEWSFDYHDYDEPEISEDGANRFALADSFELVKKWFSTLDGKKTAEANELTLALLTKWEAGVDNR